MAVDTLRLLVSWECNLQCSYCCNNVSRFRSQFTPIRLSEINFNVYSTFCISGGEPLLNLSRVHDVCLRIPEGRTVVLYTNGLLMTPSVALKLQRWGITHVNVGIHDPDHLYILPRKIEDMLQGTGIKARYHVWEGYADKVAGLQFNFHFWGMDECDRANEDRMVLREEL